MTKETFELQVQPVQHRPGNGWRVMEYAKPGQTSERQVFKTADAAKKAKKAFIARSAKYGWGYEFRVVKVVTTYEIID
jgi:hypothetical protein